MHWFSRFLAEVRGLMPAEDPQRLRSQAASSRGLASRPRQDAARQDGYRSLLIWIVAVVLLVVAMSALILLVDARLFGVAGPDGGSYSTAALENRIRSWGPWGVLGSMGLMILHSFLPFPAELLAIANGMVYGPFWGSVITWSGAMMGAWLAFGLARALGQTFLQRVLSGEHRQTLDVWSHDQGGLTLLLCRLVPVVAFNLVNYAAGLTTISWWTFTWATAVGILPLTVLMAALGDRVGEWSAWVWLLVAAMVIALWLLLQRRWRNAYLARRGE